MLISSNHDSFLESRVSVVCVPESVDNTCTGNKPGMSEDLDGMLPKEEARDLTQVFREHDDSHADVGAVYVFYVPVQYSRSLTTNDNLSDTHTCVQLATSLCIST